MAIVPDDLPVLSFDDADAFEAWLREHHADAPGLWVKMARKSSGITSISWDEAVPVALCWGWIDGQRRGLDEQYFLQRFTPRRARSVWSKINVAHVERLTAAGRMQPAGLAQVAAAKADGRWDAAYASVADNHVPKELQEALDASPRAGERFAALKSAERYSMVWKIQSVKRAETKQRHVDNFIAQLEADASTD